jgi:hypothetical protein
LYQIRELLRDHAVVTLYVIFHKLKSTEEDVIDELLHLIVMLYSVLDYLNQFLSGVGVIVLRNLFLLLLFFLILI